MNLSDYFDNTKGYGVLATADSVGKVNAALYARPHFFDENTIAFIMRERLTHANLQTNPHATYLFIQDGPGYAGKRFYLTKLREGDRRRVNSHYLPPMRLFCVRRTAHAACRVLHHR